MIKFDEETLAETFVEIRNPRPYLKTSLGNAQQLSAEEIRRIVQLYLTSGERPSNDLHQTVFWTYQALARIFCDNCGQDLGTSDERNKKLGQGIDVSVVHIMYDGKTLCEQCYRDI